MAFLIWLAEQIGGALVSLFVAHMLGARGVHAAQPEQQVVLPKNLHDFKAGVNFVPGADEAIASRSEYWLQVEPCLADPLRCIDPVDRTTSGVQAWCRRNQSVAGCHYLKLVDTAPVGFCQEHSASWACNKQLRLQRLSLHCSEHPTSGTCYASPSRFQAELRRFCQGPGNEDLETCGTLLQWASQRG